MCVVWFKGRFYLIQEVRDILVDRHVIIWKLTKEQQLKKIAVIKIRDNLVLGSLCGSGFYQRVVKNEVLQDEERIIFCSVHDSHDMCYSLLIEGENAALGTVYNRPFRTVHKNYFYSENVALKLNNHFVSVFFFE